MQTLPVWVILDAYGVKGGIFNWIKDFLVCRKQMVSVEHETSETCAVQSGVPQGTCAEDC